MSEKISLINVAKLLGLKYRSILKRVNHGLSLPFKVETVEPKLGKGMGRNYYFCDLNEIKAFCLQKNICFEQEINKIKNKTAKSVNIKSS